MYMVSVLACVPCKPEHPCFQITPSVTRETYAATLSSHCYPSEEELPSMSKKLLHSLFWEGTHCQKA